MNILACGCGGILEIAIGGFGMFMASVVGVMFWIRQKIERYL